MLFFLKLLSGANQRKRKRTWVREIFLKRIEQEVYHNLLQEMRVNDKECSFKVICIINFLEKVIKKNVWPFKVWLGPLLFIKILLKTAQLLSKHFPFGLSLFVSFICFFIKARTLLEFLNQAFNILYMFSPFSFVFINALISSS